MASLSIPKISDGNFEIISAMLIVAGWISVATHRAMPVAQVAPIEVTMPTVTVQKRVVQAAPAVETPVSFDELVARINSKFEQPIAFVNAESVDHSLTIRMDDVLLTDGGRARMSKAASDIINPLIYKYSRAFDAVNATLYYPVDTPESHIAAIERYFQSYHKWQFVKVEGVPTTILRVVLSDAQSGVGEL